jgi:MFS family permease
MYKVTYLILGVYSGIVFFMYIPVFKYMAKHFGDTALNAFILSIYMWSTYISKPVFGYLCDYYPICNRRITPYVTLACICNLVVMGMGANIDLSDIRIFAVIVGISFMCFSIIDSAARICELMIEGMTNITMDLEDRYKRISATDSFVTQEMLSDSKIQKRNYSLNFGIYVSTRYTCRLISIAFSSYYFPDASLNQVFAIFCIITLVLLIFVVVYFQELKVMISYRENLYEDKEARFTQIIRQRLELSIQAY